MYEGSCIRDVDMRDVNMRDVEMRDVEMRDVVMRDVVCGTLHEEGWYEYQWLFPLSPLAK